MAQRVITQLVSDISGDEVADGHGETIEFSYRGVNYTIDVTDKEAKAFDKAMATYVDHAAKVARGKPRMHNMRKASGADNKAIRDWANKNGFEVGDRGRIPANVTEAYHAAN